jgi:hypothetical protein
MGCRACGRWRSLALKRLWATSLGSEDRVEYLKYLGAVSLNMTLQAVKLANRMTTKKALEDKPGSISRYFWQCS